MTAIFSYGQWIDITARGTSGDQVSDILASWKADALHRLDEEERLIAELAAVKKIIEDGNPTYVGQINALLDELAQARARIKELETWVQATNPWRDEDAPTMLSDEEVDAAIAFLATLSPDPNIERFNLFDTSFDNVIATLDEIDRLRAALELVKTVLPKRASLPSVKTEMGDVLEAIDAALEVKP